MNEKKRRCADCTHYQKANDKQGECHRNPPGVLMVPVVEQGFIQGKIQSRQAVRPSGAFPPVTCNCWGCAEWKCVVCGEPFDICGCCLSDSSS